MGISFVIFGVDAVGIYIVVASYYYVVLMAC